MKSYLHNAVAVDVFCGIGGLSYGMKKAGIDVVAGIDSDESCKFAYEKNVAGRFLAKDIAEVKGQYLKRHFLKGRGKIKILVGCAPCQPFSSHTNKNKTRHNGKKWSLLNEFNRLVEETNPDIVSMENVTNLSSKPIFQRFVKSLHDKGFHVSYSNVYCPDYAVPQKRRRLVLLASKLGEIKLIPPLRKPDKYVTVEKAIGKLPAIKAGEISAKDPLHRSLNLSAENLLRIRASKPNGTWKDWHEDLILDCHKKQSGSSYKSVYGRMSWAEPSPTITTQFYNYGTGRFGHPLQDRALTVREAAILQSFPKGYRFYKSKSEISISTLGTHIGNAVPVNLGKAIGMTIREHLNKQDVERGQNAKQEKLLV